MTTAPAQTPKRAYIGHKSAQQIKLLCEQLCLTFSEISQEPSLSGFIRVDGGGATVFYSPHMGTFHGTTPEGLEFSSESDQNDDEPWFQTLCEFFLVGRIDINTADNGSADAPAAEAKHGS